MYTMQFDIKIGEYTLGMIDKVEIHKSVELLADTATITLPASQYNKALDVESKVKRGDGVTIRLGYKETGLVTEFEGYVQKVSTDGGNIKIECEDDLHLFRVAIPNKTWSAAVNLEEVLKYIVKYIAYPIDIDCQYTWAYSKFVINNATGYDVLKKIQDESGADIFLDNNILCVHIPGMPKTENGKEMVVYYDFAKNVEKEDLTYNKAEDKKFLVVVKANKPDGTVKELEVGSTGGDKIEIKCNTSDEASMKQRAETELKRKSFDGFTGSITTWLIPECSPGYSAVLHDAEYPNKDGTYFVNSVTTEFSQGGGSRKVSLGFRLS